MHGISIRTSDKKVSPDTMGQFRELGTTIIGDAMGRFQTMTGMIPYHNAGTRLVGTAVTVLTVPGDNLMVHKAIEMAKPGDVIVVDGGKKAWPALSSTAPCAMFKRSRKWASPSLPEANVRRVRSEKAGVKSTTPYPAQALPCTPAI
jgi:hypothetical protein